MNITKVFYVVDRDGLEYQHLDGSWKADRQLAILVINVRPGDLIRDVLRISISGRRVVVSSEAEDHRNFVSIGFRVSWGDQYEPGAENLVTSDFLRRIADGEDDYDSAGVWLGQHFSWSVSENKEQEIRKYIFDSENFGENGMPK